MKELKAMESHTFLVSKYFLQRYLNDEFISTYAKNYRIKKVITKVITKDTFSHFLCYLFYA